MAETSGACLSVPLEPDRVAFIRRRRLLSGLYPNRAGSALADGEGGGLPGGDAILALINVEFWDDHPEWREKTGVLQDAQLDWRKLMNLTNRAAFDEVSRGAKDLIARFDDLSALAAELGFSSHSHFAAAFRQAYGRSPTAFRQSAQRC